MASFTDFGRRLVMASKAFITSFSESAITTSFDEPEDYNDVKARRMRYAIYWSMYENTAYRSIHSWAVEYKKQYSLYKYIRNIFNPAYRLGEFWVSHLMGGMLDPQAGDGSGLSSACPIVTDNDRLRVAIARLWRDSNWQANKDIWTLHGSILGDAVLRINDDPARQNVYLEVVHPSDLTSATFDAFGNVKGYQLDQYRPHPEGGDKTALYTEICRNDLGLIHYETLLDGKPYPWNGETEAWDEEYGFVPLVVVKHHNVGMPWGWSEIHPDRSKIHEADDLSSMISDAIRKSVNPFWLFSGVSEPGSKPTAKGSAATTSKPAPGRDEMPALYSEKGDAKAQALVAPFDFPGMTGHLASVIASIEDEYPELKFEKLRMQGGASGAALRTARQPAEQKVRARRAGYDDGLRRAQQMAVAIGGYRGYRDYDGFSLDSYDAGDLEHHIGDRAVFATDAIEQIEEDTAFWDAAGRATNAGLSLEGYLREHGWDEERIQRALYSGGMEQ